MWKCAGWMCVALAVVGTVLPVMPTVPFLIAAAFCFERGSPRLHRWLMEHQTFGPPLRDWRDHRVISWRAKIITTVCILGSVGLMVYREIPFELKATASGVLLGALVFVLTRKSRRLP